MSMGLKNRVLEVLGVRTPIAVPDPAAEEGRAPVPGEIQPEIRDYPLMGGKIRGRIRGLRPDNQGRKDSERG
jgi:hypothetical protein